MYGHQKIVAVVIEEREHDVLAAAAIVTNVVSLHTLTLAPGLPLGIFTAKLVSFWHYHRNPILWALRY